MTPLALLLLPLLAAVISSALPERYARWRDVANIAVAAAKLALVVLLLVQAQGGVAAEWRYAFLPGHDILLRVDRLALLFISLSVSLWLLTTIYAIGYFGRGPNLRRFFGFFNLCVLSTTGVALAGTAVTFFLFYELLTLTTWPLIVHKGDAKSFRAGRIYLAYTLAGSAAFLIGIVWLKTLVGSIEFTEPPDLSGLAPLTARLVFVLCVGGLAVKAALVPLHGWLPNAMAAPAPVSALLHAVAVVKAGAYGVIRLVFDVFGIETVHALGLGAGLAVMASVTIVCGSVRALTQADIKKRLAYSTVSQVSYILLGASIASPYALVGALAHLVHQGVIKITLFMGAGALAKQLGIKTVHQLDGAGRAMPVTMAAFTVGALGMIGVPPVAGFATKWYLGLGGLQAGAPWVVAVLAASSLLNAAYFFPLVYRAWFKEAPSPLPRPTRGAFPLMLVLPPAVTALAAVAAGVFAASGWSAVGLARTIVEAGYLR